MDLFSELIDAAQSDLTIGDETSLTDLTTVKLAINRAYRKIGAIYKWPDTRDAKKTSTVANQEYYDYPPTWRPDSIWKLMVNGEDYGDPLAFKDYLYEQENNYPSGGRLLWSNQRRRYFISPTPTTSGLSNISVWGFKTVTVLSGDADVTIFSYNMPEVNEAIVLEADAILKAKGEIQQMLRRNVVSGSEMLSTEAGRIVAASWSKIAAENAKYEKTIPGFDVPDFFASGINNRNALRNKIGNF